jgi:putative colanic acid biosynthesis UDP-glucose lipid carrier transferase
MGESGALLMFANSRMDPEIGLNRRPGSARLKRGLDVVAAASALVVLTPFLLMIALLISLTSPGPVLFRQRRTGLNGRVFTIFKFRTMSVTEDDEAVTQARRGDSRVTPLGAVLRRSSIDELPQLLNILRGEMSIVGPRPHALVHDAHYSALIPAYRDRFAVRPGLTGYAQIQGLRGEIHQLDCMVRRIAADTAYARNWSLTGDLGIVLRTAPLLISRQNAY